MERRTFVERHPILLQGVGLGFGAGFTMAFGVQLLLPFLSKLPGLFLCGGGSFELMLRRRTSFGVCEDGAQIHFAVILAVSTVVWTVVCTPLAVAFAHVRARKKEAGS